MTATGFIEGTDFELHTSVELRPQGGTDFEVVIKDKLILKDGVQLVSRAAGSP